MDNLLQTPTLTTRSLNNVELMVQEVADLVGGSGDVDVREKAMRLLDRAADRMNGAGVYLFRKKEATFGTSPAFTANQSTLSLPSDWAWATDPGMAYDSNGNCIQILEWKPWEIYRMNLQTTASNITSVPCFLSIMNELDATAYLYPYIDTAKVATIKLTYFARILRLSEVTDGNVYLSPEARECLIAGGQAMMIRQRYMTKPAIWEPMMNDFDRMIQLAKSAAFRNQQAEHISIRVDEAGNLAGGYYSAGPRTTVYIGF